MTIEDIAGHRGEWLKGDGPDRDVVISSRVRLARNIAQYPFHPLLTKDQNEELTVFLEQQIQGADLDGRLTVLELAQLSDLDRLVLFERHLISREHAQAQGRRAVAFNDEESLSVMLNEEDHLRIQILRAGLRLDEAWQATCVVESKLEQRVQYAFDPQLGYLTACPTNVGTGLRVSVLLHLPALVMTRHIQRVYNTVSKINLTVRGLYGEGTQAVGDCYQISNQATLGRSEEDILADVQGVVARVIEYEREARRRLLDDSRLTVEDRLWRAYHTLLGARKLASNEALTLLSHVRLSHHVEIIRGVDLETINDLFLRVQPAHLQKLVGKALDEQERDAARAQMVRKALPLVN